MNHICWRNLNDMVRFYRVKLNEIVMERARCFAYLQFKNVDSAMVAIDLNNTYWDEEHDPDRQLKMKNLRWQYQRVIFKVKKYLLVCLKNAMIIINPNRVKKDVIVIYMLKIWVQILVIEICF
jgi:hypothetical protein